MEIHINILPKSIELPVIGNVHIAVLVNSIVTFVLCVFCIVVYFLVKYKFKDTPGRFQHMLESGVDWIRSYCRTQTTHEIGDELAPYILAVALFIAGNCLVEYFAMDPPASDLSMTLTMGLVTLAAVNIMGFRHKKLKGRIHHFLEPVPVVAPFKLISELFIPVSLGCRLYGNILSGVIVMALLYTAAPLVVPGALSLYFSLFHAAIQSYVFITLTLSFIREAVE